MWLNFQAGAISAAGIPWTRWRLLFAVEQVSGAGIGIWGLSDEGLSIGSLCNQAGVFAKLESEHDESSLYGITDGKAVGTYLEHKFQAFLAERYDFTPGSSAKGIDFPELEVDLKVTSIKQPQSSCPYRSARQKIYGIGYGLLVFCYEKIDQPETSTARLKIIHTIFIDADRTADFQTTSGLLKILENDGNEDDLVGFIFDRNLPVDEIGAANLAQELLRNPPKLGYLTISNALQWRLQYKHAISKAGHVSGVRRLRS